MPAPPSRLGVSRLGSVALDPSIDLIRLVEVVTDCGVDEADGEVQHRRSGGRVSIAVVPDFDDLPHVRTTDDARPSPSGSLAEGDSRVGGHPDGFFQQGLGEGGLRSPSPGGLAFELSPGLAIDSDR
jgi:hypothetical protein